MGLSRRNWAVVVCALAAAAPAAWSVTLGVTPDGRFFTLDGVPTFLNGVSYYGAQSISTPSFVTADLDDMVADGFNWIRVWMYWKYFAGGEDVSVMTHDGVIRPVYMNRLKTLIAECDARGMIVDCSLNRDGNGIGAGPRNQAEHLVAVQTLTTELLPYRNVYIDVSNERDIRDARFVSLADCGQLVTAIKAIDPNRLCTASSVPGSQSEMASFRNVAKMDFITPHLCRNSGCSAQTVGTVKQYITWMSNLGFRIPVHLQEPFRRGFTAYNPTVEDFLRDCSGGKIAEAAGWCLHNGSDFGGRPYRCFLMSDPEGRLYSQWDSVEQQVTTDLDDQIAGVNARLRRYQAEYSEQVSHGTGARDGFAWSANVAAHSAGYLSFGPYITTVPAGRHAVTWRMKIDSTAGANDVVVTLDVARNNGSVVLASLDVRRQDFTTAGVWQDFSLLFDSTAGNSLEFRSYWHDRARIDLDHITLSIGAVAQLAFTDITGPSGTAGPAHFGGHGAMWADVTGDTRPDCYVTMNFSTPMPELFYRNEGGTSFAEEAALRGIDDPDDGSHGGVWGDLDNDGDYDLVNGGYDRNRVFENGGTGFFTDRTGTSGLLDLNRGTRGTLAFDFDRDGDLDVFCNNWAPLGEPNEFYRNDGGFQFVSIDNGLGGAIGVQGATEGDYDNDGDLDLVLCQGYGYTGNPAADGPLMLMRNDNGTFTNVAAAAGLVNTGTTQQGPTFCDINNDGWLDLHIQLGPGSSRLYRNNGNGTFTQIAVPAGPGFMAGFEDIDNDGDWDMVYAGDNKVYLNNGQGTFTPSGTFSLGTVNDPRAVAFADIDDDGDVDFFYGQKRAYNILIRNDLADGGNWLKLRLVSPSGQAGAFGAKVKTFEPGQVGNPAAMISFREARSNEGYLGQNDPVLHFGLGPRLRADVQVTFPDGSVVTRSNVAANQTLIIDASPPEPPVVVVPPPLPDTATVGVQYVKQLTLSQGNLPVTWSVVSGPAGLQVDASGRVYGWTPSAGQADSTQTLEIKAENAAGSDTASWQVGVIASPQGSLGVFPFDSSAQGWAFETWKSGPFDPGAGSWQPFGGSPGGHLYSTGSGTTNSSDSCTREGTRIIRAVPTTDHDEIQVQYDVRVTLDTPPAAGCSGSCQGSLLGGSCEDKLVVSYSTAGTSGPWTAAQTLTEGVDLPAVWTRRVIDLSGVPEAARNMNFALKFEWQFNTATDTGRIDNVSVLGTLRLPFRADYDDDEDVDQTDFGYFQACFSGSGRPRPLGCEWADVDDDLDVDAVDFSLFETCLGGANQPPMCD